MTNKYIISIIITLSCYISSFSQIRKTAVPTKTITSIKKVDKGPIYTKWSLKAGANISVIYLARNIKDKNNAPGYCGGITYEVNDFIRVSSL